MLNMQWHLFPFQFIALLFSFTGWHKTGMSIMLLTIILAAICFNTHITSVLNIIL
jgi:hypothetical protein